MDAGLNHFGHAHHGALQLSFERALIVDVLDKLGGAEIRFVEKLEPDPAGFRESGAGQCEARFSQLRGRHQNRTAAVG